MIDSISIAKALRKIEFQLAKVQRKRGMTKRASLSKKNRGDSPTLIRIITPM